MDRRLARTAGIEHVQVMPTGGHPVVYGDWLHAPGKPTVMIYGHFDTQPVDPLELWTARPSSRSITDGRVYARGASDDKGNMLMPDPGRRGAAQERGQAAAQRQVPLRGAGGDRQPAIAGLRRGHRGMLAGRPGDRAPTAASGRGRSRRCWSAFKGLCAVQIDVKGAKTDLHSGSYGGADPEPAPRPGAAAGIACAATMAASWSTASTTT